MSEPALIRGVLGVLLFFEKVHRVFTGRDGYVEPADHHLVPTLVTPVDFLGSIGVSGVIRRVIEVSYTVYAGARRQHFLVTQVIEKLPTEIVLRNAQQHFGFAGRIEGRVDEIFAAQVHVRHHVDQ